MRIRAAIATVATVLLGLTVASCSSSDGEAAPAVTTPPSTSTPAAATSTPLSVSWVRRLQVLALDSCRESPFAAACMTDAMELQTAVIELTGEADRRGDQTVKAEAVQIAADLQRYIDECATSKSGSPERTRCLTLLVKLPNTHEGLVAAIHESEAK
jgi:hypothetical protein